MYLNINKILITFLFSLIFCNISFAESYYFKKCTLNATVIADYLIDIDNKVIRVTLKTTDGKTQQFKDKIQSIEKDKIISKKIKSGRDEDTYFIYYLDAQTQSIIKQNYKKEKSINFVSPDGPKIQNYCADVKADWDAVKKKEEKKKEVELKEKKEKEIKKKKEEVRLKVEQKAKEEKNNRNITVISKKWIKFNKYDANSGNQLKIDFDKKASEICLLTGQSDFDILKKKVEIAEIDETPAFGLETVIKLEIIGVVKCK